MTPKTCHSAWLFIPARSTEMKFHRVNELRLHWSTKRKLKRLQQGGRKSIRKKQWEKFTVNYSMKRFIRNGGGIIGILTKGEIALAVISNKP